MKKKIVLLTFLVVASVNFSIEKQSVESKKEEIKIEINTSHGKTLNDMGTYYANNKQYEIAEKFYLASLSKENDNATYFNLGLLYRRTKRREESAECFKKAYELTKKPEILEHLGHIYAVMGETDEAKYFIAKDYFKKAYEAGYKDGKYNYAAMLEKLGEINEAKIIFEELAPTETTGDSYFHLGKIYLKEKNMINLYQITLKLLNSKINMCIMKLP